MRATPDGRWSDFAYKTVAIALQNRRLVEVSKRGGAWKATILPAGVNYLAEGDYPPGHWQVRPTRSQTRCKCGDASHGVKSAGAAGSSRIAYRRSDLANTGQPVSSRRRRGVQGRIWGEPSPYRGRTGNG
jgi:hypothetical protein